jgi:hypothetical protein
LLFVLQNHVYLHKKFNKREMIKKSSKYNVQMLTYLDRVDTIFKVDIINNLEKPVWVNGACELRGAVISTSYQVHRALLNLYYREVDRLNTKNVVDTGKDIKEVELEDLDFSMM